MPPDWFLPAGGLYLNVVMVAIRATPDTAESPKARGSCEMSEMACSFGKGGRT